MNPMILAALAEGGGSAAAGAGEAAGGSGEVMKALSGVTDQLKNMKSPADALNSSLANLQIQGSAATTILATFGNVLEKIPIIGPELQKLTLSFATLESQLKSLNQFVAGFSPLDAKLLDRAFADLNASFGEQLVPVIRAGTDVVRWFGDTLAGLTPIIRPLIEQGLNAVAPLFQTIGTAIRNLLQSAPNAVAGISRLIDIISDPRIAQSLDSLTEAIGPMLTSMGSLTGDIAQLAVVSGAAELSIRMFTNVIRVMIQQLDLLGLTSGILNRPLNFDDASRGKAFVPASQTNPQDLITRMQTQAFGMGSSSPEMKTAQNTGTTVTYLQTLVAYFTGGKFILDMKNGLTRDIGHAADNLPNLSRPTIPTSHDVAGGLVPVGPVPVFGMTDAIRRLRRTFNGG